MIGIKRKVALALLAAGLTLGNTAQADLLYNIMDLGTLGGNYIGATSINASGQVTGGSIKADGSYSAFVTNTNGRMIDLGTLGGIYNYGSQGSSINASGQVVGYSYGYGSERHAFITDNGTMIDLNSVLGSNTTGWILNEATGINDSSHIVGNGIHNGEQRAFLLTPVSDVPVPAAVWLFTGGLGLLAFTNRRKDLTWRPITPNI